MQGGWKVRWRRRTAHRDYSSSNSPARGDATLLKLRQLSQAVKRRSMRLSWADRERLGRTQTPDLREDGCGVCSAAIEKGKSERQRSLQQHPRQRQ